MANIAVVSSAASTNSVTRVGEALTAAGHTYTGIADDNILSVDFSSYALIIIARIDQAKMSDVAEAVMRAGKPLIVGGVINGQSTFSTNALLLPYWLGTGTADDHWQGTVAGSPASTLTPTAAGAAHAIFSGYTAGTNYNPKVGTTVNEVASCSLGSSTFGTVLANGVFSGLTGDPMVVVYESGTKLNNGWVLAGRVVYLGFLNGETSDFSADGDTFIQRSVTWALAGTAYDAAGVNAEAFRAYAVVGPPAGAVSAEAFRAYAVLAPPSAEISVASFRAYVVVGDAVAPPVSSRRPIANVNFV